MNFIHEVPESSWKGSNPWSVDSLMAFNFFVCPECEFQNHNYASFRDHAIGVHEKAFQLWSARSADCKDPDPMNWESGLGLGDEDPLEVDVIAIQWENEEEVDYVSRVFEAHDIPVADSVTIGAEESIHKGEGPKAKKKSSKRKHPPGVGKPCVKPVTNATPDGLYQCDKCLTRFDTKFDLDNHAVRAEYGNVFRCRSCDANEFASVDAFKLHLFKAHQDSSLGVVCDKCPRTFLCKGDFNRHMAVVHSTERASVCEKCGASFKDKSYLAYHMATHESTEKRTCHICQAVTKGTYDLGKHYILKHPEVDLARDVADEDTAVCPECSMLVAKKNLAKHRLGVHMVGYEESSLECNICHKKVSNTNHMRLHKKTMHDTVSKHVCETCSVGFKSFVGYKRHMMIRHSDWSGGRRCPECNITLYNDTLFLAHVKKFHPDMGNAYECEVCGCKVGSMSAMRTHRRRGVCERYVPTDPTLHDCKECGRHFSGFRKLKPHMELEHPGIPCRYPCPDCNKVLSNPSAVYLHRKKYCQPKKMSKSGKQRLKKGG